MSFMQANADHLSAEIPLEGVATTVLYPASHKARPVLQVRTYFLAFPSSGSHVHISVLYAALASML